MGEEKWTSWEEGVQTIIAIWKKKSKMVSAVVEKRFEFGDYFEQMWSLQVQAAQKALRFYMIFIYTFELIISISEFKVNSM